MNKHYQIARKFVALFLIIAAIAIPTIASATEVTIGYKNASQGTEDCPELTFTIQCWASYGTCTSTEVEITSLRNNISNTSENVTIDSTLFVAQDTYKRHGTDVFFGQSFATGPIPPGTMNFGTEIDIAELCNALNYGTDNVYQYPCITDNGFYDHSESISGFFIARFYETVWTEDGRQTQFIGG